MKNTKRGAKRPADVDAAGVNLNEVLVASPSSELEVRLWKDGTVEFRTIENEAGICTTRPQLPIPHARALARWLLANAGKRGAA